MNKLEIDIKLGGVDEKNILWVNQMPPQQPRKQSMNLTLLVRWPYRSIWKGDCPTSQKYDFFIEQNGNIVWQWSNGRVFNQVHTTVEISGGDWEEFTETWQFQTNEIAQGKYTARAIFIASGQEISKNFEVKFAY